VLVYVWIHCQAHRKGGYVYYILAVVQRQKEIFPRRWLCFGFVCIVVSDASPLDDRPHSL